MKQIILHDQILARVGIGRSITVIVGLYNIDFY